MTDAEAEADAKRLRELDIDTLVAEAVGMYAGSPGRKAEIELERRHITESIRASGRLLFATWVIAVLTVVLIGITLLALLGKIGD